MQCQGTTKSGRQCRNQASANGYCHLHGGIPSLRALRNQARREYTRMSPEQRRDVDQTKDAIMWGCTIVLLMLALLYGAATGDWEGILRWLSN